MSGKLPEVQKNDNASFLPAAAEATEVNELLPRFAEAEVVPAIVVYERARRATPDDLSTVAGDVGAIQALPMLAGSVSPPIPSQDGKAAQLIVPLDSAPGSTCAATVE